jgi:flagellar hook assembly protein FlgD
LDGVDARVEIYDPAGKRVRVLSNVRAGRNYPATDWDGRSDDGSPVASGVYFVRMTWNGGSVTARAMWLR